MDVSTMLMASSRSKGKSGMEKAVHYKKSEKDESLFSTKKSVSWLESTLNDNVSTLQKIMESDS